MIAAVRGFRAACSDDGLAVIGAEKRTGGAFADDFFASVCACRELVFVCAVIADFPDFAVDRAVAAPGDTGRSIVFAGIGASDFAC